MASIPDMKVNVRVVGHPDYLTVADRHALLRLAMSEMGPRRDRLRVMRDRDELNYKNSIRAKYVKQNAKL